MEAPRDQNHVPTLLAVSNANGTTTIPVQASGVTHFLSVDDDVTGTDLSGADALRDGSHVTGILAVSSDDGITPVPVYIDSITGKLLIQST